jgi:hypothetical protein
LKVICTTGKKFKIGLPAVIGKFGAITGITRRFYVRENRVTA